MKIDDIMISAFPNAMSTEPTQIRLTQFIHSTKYRDKIEAVRNAATKEERDNLKKGLPCATISGTFTKRNVAGLVTYNSLVCLDFDAKDNPSVSAQEIKTMLGIIPEIAFAALSVSGAGVWAIVPTNNDSPDEHPKVVRVLERIFAHIGLTIDKSCKDVCRLRFVSFDETPVVNPNPSVFDAQKFLYAAEPERRAFWTGSTANTATMQPSDTRTKLEKCIRDIESRRMDLTEDYETWVRLGFALASEFGTDGEDYFQRISQFHPSYDQNKCSKKYNDCVKSGRSVGIGTFFQICKDSNISL